MIGVGAGALALFGVALFAFLSPKRNPSEATSPESATSPVATPAPPPASRPQEIAVPSREPPTTTPILVDERPAAEAHPVAPAPAPKAIEARRPTAVAEAKPRRRGAPKGAAAAGVPTAPEAPSKPVRQEPAEAPSSPRRGSNNALILE